MLTQLGIQSWLYEDLVEYTVRVIHRLTWSYSQSYVDSVGKWSEVYVVGCTAKAIFRHSWVHSQGFI